jgi:hypothetical protein
VREQKIACEAEVKAKAAQLTKLNRRLAELTEAHDDAHVAPAPRPAVCRAAPSCALPAASCAVPVASCTADGGGRAREQGALDRAKGELAQLLEERLMDGRDLVMLLRVKQGQVECEHADIEMLHDGGAGTMVEVELVHRLNAAVRALGKDKAGMMQESHASRNKIHAVNWETQMLDLKATDVAENIRYFQLLWVTKDLQVAIKGGQDDRRMAQNVTLERQIEHCKTMHQAKVEDMKQRLFKAHKHIRGKELENDKLGDYVQDLAVSVAQREKILRVRQSEDGEVDEAEYKMQEVIWRRLVLEEARQQSEDIAVLKAEVDRLRQRTFPSFARSYAQQMGQQGR